MRALLPEPVATVLRTRWAPYVLAVILTLGALALRQSLVGWVGDRPVLILFMIPIIISAYVGGAGPGILSTAIAAAAAAYFLLPPIGSFGIERSLDFAQWLTLIVSGVLISLSNEHLHRLRQRSETTVAEREQAEVAMRESEERLQAVIETMSEGLVIFDFEGRLLYRNRAAPDIHGFAVEVEVVDPVWEFERIYEFSTLDGTVLPLEEWPLSRILRGEKLHDVELHIRRRDIEWRRVLSYGGSLIDDAVRGRVAFLTVIDITERKQTEALLRAKQEHSESLLRLSKNLERAVTYADVLSAAQEEIRSTLGLSSVWIYLFNEDRTALKLLVADERISERARLEDATSLRIEGDRMLEEIAEARDIVVVEDARTDERTNKAIVGRLGNRTIINVPITMMARKLGALGTGTFGDEGLRIPTPIEREFLSALASHVAASLDRTLAMHERERAERRLTTQAAVSRVLAESSSLREATAEIIGTLCETEGWDFGTFWAVDESNGVLRCIKLWSRPGMEVEELSARTRAVTFAPGVGLPGRVWSLGTPLLIPDISRDSMYLRTSEAIAAGLRSALAFPIRVNGDTIGAIDFLGREIHEADERLLEMFGAIGRQIGGFMQRRRAETALRQSEARFATAFRASPTPLVLTRIADGHYVEVNDAFITMIGYGREELIGHTAVELNQVSDETHVRLIDQLQTHGSVRDVEIPMRAKSGAIRQMRISMESIELDGEALSLSIGMDITEQRNLESKLRQTQKMDSIGLLAGGVAHDFNNVLTVITGASDILLSSLPPEDPSRELLEEIRTAGARAATLTGQLLAFSRRQMLEPKVLDLNVVITDTAKMLRRLLGEDIVLETELAPSLHSIKVDHGNLVQVLLNLAVNARDAMPTGGRLTIETANAHLGEDYTATHAEVRPGHYVTLSISDTGRGIRPEVKEHLFEPFFTTKGLGHGTGLGLAVVHGIVAQSGGRVEVYSEEGIGTMFRLYFPAHQVETDADAVQEQPRRGDGHETILVVEDDPGVRDVAIRSLRGAGYTVLEAGNGKEALAVLAEHSGGVDLILTDVVMPVMSGRELAENVRVLHPELKVLFTSGYTDDAVVRHGILAAEVAFLQKPYTPSSLAAKVRDILDGRAR